MHSFDMLILSISIPLETLIPSYYGISYIIYKKNFQKMIAVFIKNKLHKHNCIVYI